MNKITDDHLSRTAYVYVRQSTPSQLVNNPESRRRQYGLEDRARALGWKNVIVVDDDLGRTASGTPRFGFEHLLTAVCTGAAGAVFTIERNLVIARCFTDVGRARLVTGVKRSIAIE